MVWVSTTDEEVPDSTSPQKKKAVPSQDTASLIHSNSN